MPLQFANPVWIDGGVPDFSCHLRRIVLPAARPGSPISRPVSAACTRRRSIADTPCGSWRSSTAWPDGEIGLYLKIHHAALDGVSGMALAGTLFDATAEPAEVPADWRQRVGEAEACRSRAAARAHFSPHRCPVREAGASPAGGAAVADRAGQVAPAAAGCPGWGRTWAWAATPLNVPITAERGFAAVSLSLAGVKEIAPAARGDAQRCRARAVQHRPASNTCRRTAGVPRKSLIGHHAGVAARCREHRNDDPGDADAGPLATHVPIRCADCRRCAPRPARPRP
jgi:diacylglycerol O-acyltransferase